ncbi:MAG: peptidoglycan DD-metalloendopeptidase family protein [Bacteriovoracaceae bacterium]|nr:peptidoglycan DD-metalloendopeptidase family protein [Bacteroidota bacterium]
MSSLRSYVLLVITVCSLLPASQTDIKRKDQQLKRLRAEIQRYEQQIEESEKKEKATLGRLDIIEKKANLVRTLLEGLREEEQLIRLSIDNSREIVSQLEKQLTFLKNHYANYVASVYKYGKVYDLETILSSNSINQLYIRIEYMKRFSDQRKKDLEKIVAKKEQIEIEHSTLQEKLSMEQQLISEKIKEENALNKTKERRKNALMEIREDKSQLREVLTRKISAAKQLENLITDLIEKERIRKEKAEREERERKERIARERAAQRERERLARIEREKELTELKRKNDLAKAKEKEREIAEANRRAVQREKEYEIEAARVELVMRPLNERKGKLMWPVSGGRVVAEFGNQVHPVMKTITTNTGIDISTKENTPVRCVADGEVALIHWLPSYGNLIIINHSHGYRTVYAHLSEMSVITGQQIKEGTVIAKSGESVSGNLLHFEVWKEKDKQNPREWLARR